MQTDIKKFFSFILVCTIVSSLLLSLAPVAVVSAATAVSYTDAPYAGVYQVTSDKAVTVTSELGSTATIAAGQTKYLYLLKGANTLEQSDTSATLTMTGLDNNGMDYLNQITIGSQPIISGQEDSVSTNLYKSLAPGETYTFTYTPSKAMAGIVYPYIYFTDTAENTIRVTSDTGFYADILKPSGYNNTLCWADAARKDVELLYVRSGKNTLTLENIGNNTAVIGNISIHSAGELSTHEDWGSQINVANLKPIIVELPTPTPTVTPTATPTPVATATPAPVLPEVSNSSLYTVIEAENAISTSAAAVTYNGKTALKLTNTVQTSATYTITTEQETVYNLNLVGAAWKDVSFNLSVDNTPAEYLTMSFDDDRSSTAWPYLQEEITSLHLGAGTHTLKFDFYCDTFYFDSIVLEDTNSMYYHLIHDFKNVTTSEGAYNLLKQYGKAANIDVDADTVNHIYAPMSFWKMVAKDFDNGEELLAAYTDCIADPTVAVKNSDGQEVGVLPAGLADISVNCVDIPADVSLIAGVYNGNKLIDIRALTREGDAATTAFANLSAGSTLKVLAFAGLDSATPYAKDVYGTVYREIYVATTGKSTNPGTQLEPVNNLANAMKIVKSINQDMTGDIIVNVAPGTYKSTVTINIDPTMGGKNGHKVIIRAADMTQKPVFSGGEDLTGKWKQVSGQNYWVATTTTRETRALFVNGYQATMARSDGWYAGVLMDPATPKNDSHVTDGIMVSFYGNSDFPKGLDQQTATQQSRMQIVFSLAWANHRFPIDGISYDDNNAYVYTTYPYYNAFCIDGLHTDTITPGNGADFYLENSLLLLDQPGEFYFDKAARKMYYYPYAQEDMATVETWCAVTDGMVNISGVSSQNKVTNLEFDGISFRYGGWDDITVKGAAFNQTDEWRLGSETYYGQHIFPGQIWVKYADSLVFKNCEFASMGSSALIFEEGVSNSRITGSYFHDLAGTGVMLGDYRDGNSAPVNTERCKNITVDNNIFRRTAQEFQGLTPISVYYAGNVSILHNDIKDTPYTGISIGWGWGYDDPADCGNHNISYNKIDRVMQTMGDGGHIYTLGNLRGTQINDNYIIDPGQVLAPGIYFDQGTGYTTACDNVVTEAYTTSTDRWLFARKYVNINNCFVGYNHTDGRDPTSFYGSQGTSTSEVALNGNNYRVSSYSDTAQKIMAAAGPQDKTMLNSISAYPSWRTMRMMDIPTE